MNQNLRPGESIDDKSKKTSHFHLFSEHFSLILHPLVFFTLLVLNNMQIYRVSHIASILAYSSKHFIMNQRAIISVALTFMLFLGTNTYAKSWRINSITSHGAAFADINAAMNSTEVQDGDTLYLDPGSDLKDQQVVTKQVTIIGNGFFHHQAQPYGGANISGKLIMKAEKSKIEGVTIKEGCVISANNVTVERCYIYGYGISSSGDNCKYATIRNCFFASSYPFDDDYKTFGIQGQGSNSSNTECWIIENNIITASGYSQIKSLYSAKIINNYVSSYAAYCIREMNNCSIMNNIIVNSRSMFIYLSDCVLINNVLSCDEGTYPNNKCIGSNDLNTIFTMKGDNDLKYQLCEGSPAKGYAADGGDCGPYGSGYKYVPGGLPYGLPYYTEASIVTKGHDGKLKVTLKIAVEDE